MKRVLWISAAILVFVGMLITILILVSNKKDSADSYTPSPTAEPTPTATILPPAYHNPSPIPTPSPSMIFPEKYEWLNRSRIDIIAEYEGMNSYAYPELDSYIANNTIPGSRIMPLIYWPMDSGERIELIPSVYDVLEILPPEMDTFEFVTTGITAVRKLSVPFINIIETENMGTEYMYLQYGGTSYAAPGINKYAIAYTYAEKPEIAVQNMLVGLRSLIRDYRAEIRVEIEHDIFSINFDAKKNFIDYSPEKLHPPLSEWIPKYSFETVGEAIGNGFLIDLGSYHNVIEIDAAAVVLFSGQYKIFIDKFIELNPSAQRNFIKEKLDDTKKYYCELLKVDDDYFTEYLPLYWETKGYDFEIEDLNESLNSKFNSLHLEEGGILVYSVFD